MPFARHGSLLLVAVIALATSSSADSLEQRGPYAAAEVLADAGLRDEALEAVVEVAKMPPHPPIPKRFHRSTVSSGYRAARRLMEAGFEDEAREGTIEAAKSAGAEPVPSDLRHPRHRAVEPYKAARVLMAAGFGQEARKEILKVAGSAPHPTVPTELREPSQTPSQAYAGALALHEAGHFKDAREEAIKAASTSGAEVPEELRISEVDLWRGKLGDLPDLTTDILYLAIPLSLLWAVVVFFRARAMSIFGRPRYAFATVNSLQAPTDAEPVASSLHARILDELLAVAAPIESMKGSEAGGKDLPTLVELPSELAFVGPLLSWLRRRPHLTLNGTLHPQANHLEVSLEIGDQQGRVFGRKRFGTDEEGADGMNHLAKCAAAWSAIEFHRYRHDCDPPEVRDLLGTASWESAVAASQGDALRALRIDPRNTTAMLIQGAREARIFNQSCIAERGIRRIETALRDLRQREQKNRRWWHVSNDIHRSPEWFRAKYQLTTARLHLFAYLEEHADERASELLKQGLRDATDLARAVGATGKALLAPSRRRFQFDRRAPATASLQLMMAADARTLVVVLAAAKASVEFREQSSGIREPPKNDEEVGESDAELFEWLARLTVDNLPSAYALLARVRRDLPSKDFCYNLACFYARARQSDRALDELSQYFAYEAPSRVQAAAEWARADPSLAPVRHREEGKFEALLAKYAPALPPAG